MRYKEGRPEEREYDACYYQIAPVNPGEVEGLEINSEIAPRIIVSFYKKVEMNVYIYAGPNRFEARESIVDGNE